MLAYVHAFAYLFSPNFMLEFYLGKAFYQDAHSLHQAPAPLNSTPLKSLFHAILARAYATMERPRGSCSCCYSIASKGCSHSPTSTRDPSKRGTASLRRSNNANQLGLEAIAERDLPEIIDVDSGEPFPKTSFK